MNEGWTLNQEEFDKLLTWLDPDRERAGQKLIDISCKIVRIYARRGCPVAEEIADKTTDRVIRKLPEIAETYKGDQTLYFYKVSKFVYKEYLKSAKDQGNLFPPPQPDPAEEKERRSQCLEKCMNELDHEEQVLVLDYYRDEKRAKIDRRKKMAEQRGITLNTLRTRVHRIMIVLHECFYKCLENAEDLL